jgi:hypothetical protein
METDAAIDELVRAFEACTLPKARWTHQAHLATALWYLRRLPRDEATPIIRRNIQKYNLSAGGSPDGYHETITLAWIAVITQFLQAHDHGQSQAELTQLLIKECCDKDYLLRWWSKEVLLSEGARRGWVDGDRAELS